MNGQKRADIQVGMLVDIVLKKRPAYRPTDAKPVLGTWQGIYFCEFDGPRNRKYYVKIM